MAGQVASLLGAGGERGVRATQRTLTFALPLIETPHTRTLTGLTDYNTRDKTANVARPPDTAQQTYSSKLQDSSSEGWPCLLREYARANKVLASIDSRVVARDLHEGDLEPEGWNNAPQPESSE